MPTDPQAEHVRGILRAVEDRANWMMRNEGVAFDPGYRLRENNLGALNRRFLQADLQFAAGYDSGTGLSTIPFTSDMSIVGGTDIVVG